MDTEKKTKTALNHIELDDEELARNTVFYLAYGSNLANETFLGRRGIRPIAEYNVYVPSLRLMFDLEALPYKEPVMANSGIRQQDGVISASMIQPETQSNDELNLDVPSLSKTDAALKCPDYHKLRWRKGLVGVAYELTPKDFAHVIATEGGGSRYLDIKVQCFVLDRGLSTTPEKPDGKSYVAHTLYAPPSPPVGSWPEPRPVGYAQPSARYLKLITNGAAERALPDDYREYLSTIRPYRAQTLGTKLGGLVFTTIFTPLVMLVFTLQRMFQDKNGLSPPWLVNLFSRVSRLTWWTYDHVFKPVFGDGERSASDIPNCPH